jgi:hypothetical protein
MVIPCAFYGFVNRTTKVTLQVEQAQLEVGQAIAYEGESYVILSVFEADGQYRANVGLAHLHPTRFTPRLKTVPPHPPAVEGKPPHDSRRDTRESALQTSLQAAEAKLQDLLRERDEVLKRLEDAIQQLDRIHQNARR